METETYLLIIIGIVALLSLFNWAIKEPVTKEAILGILLITLSAWRIHGSLSFYGCLAAASVLIAAGWPIWRRNYVSYYPETNSNAGSYMIMAGWFITLLLLMVHWVDAQVPL